MASTFTANTGLEQPANGDYVGSWQSPINNNAAKIDALAPIGGLNVALTEVPSASLNVKVSAGVIASNGGVVTTYAGTAAQAMTASNTNYVYLDASGTLHVNTTGFPTSAHVRLATVVAGVSTITSITDSRVTLHTIGTPQPTATGETSGYTAGSSTAVTIDGHTTGGTGSTSYTLGDLVAALKALNLIAS